MNADLKTVINPEVEALLNKHDLWRRSDCEYNAAVCLTMDALTELEVLETALQNAEYADEFLSGTVERAVTLLQDAKRLLALDESPLLSRRPGGTVAVGRTLDADNASASDDAA
jgi:hypothetical protein